LTINGSVVPEFGSLALSETEDTKIEFCGRAQPKATLIFRNFEKLDFDCDAGTKQCLEFDCDAKSSENLFANFLDKSFPNGCNTKRTEFRSVPFHQIYKDPLGVVWRRFIVAKPVQATRPETAGGSPTSSYLSEVSIPLTEGQTLNLTDLKLGTNIIEFKDKNGLIWNKQVFRSSGTEVGFRLSGLLSPSSSFIFVGDGMFIHFFENLPGAQWGDWGTHRFGLKLRSFGTVAQVDGSSFSTPTALSSTSAEARMNFKDSLWNLDEVFGGLVGMTQFSWQGASASYIAAGFYWGRSMPKGLDQIFNQVPWFRGQKYVDLDFALLNPITSGADFGYTGNFHGKLFITRDFYIEAGLGFFSLSSGIGKSLSTQLGTFGLGLLL
jgi:hypothetical protein